MLRHLTIPLFLLAVLSLTCSCHKEKGTLSITFSKDDPFVYQDKMVGLGDTVRVRLVMEWNGSELLHLLEVTVNDQQVQAAILDVESANFDLTMEKGPEDEEVWKFVLTDAGGYKATLTLTLTLDPNSGFGQIKYYESLTLGAQANTGRAGFFSVSSGTLYNLLSAFQNQSEVDLLCYYDENDKMVLSSPGANLDQSVFQGLQNVVLWPTRNTTYFIKTTMTTTDFDQVVHDGPIREAYTNNDPKRKAKKLAVDDIYAFKLNNGKLGLLKVTAVTNGIDGEVTFSLKAQQ
ncbi:MAG: hypothetical protein J7L89_03725 [Bacteroidales bacterium]|nr:hypothetical protein [Bacteroidales bacterium]